MHPGDVSLLDRAYEGAAALSHVAAHLALGDIRSARGRRAGLCGASSPAPFCRRRAGRRSPPGRRTEFRPSAATSARSARRRSVCTSSSTTSLSTTVLVDKLAALPKAKPRQRGLLAAGNLS
jgi:hypothetical protein